MQQVIQEGTAAGRNMTESQNVLDTLSTGTPEQIENIINKGIELGQITGTLKELRAPTAALSAAAKTKAESQKQTNVLRKDVLAANKVLNVINDPAPHVISQQLSNIFHILWIQTYPIMPVFLDHLLYCNHD